ncbi:MAG TPA: GNAT family protein [Streptosporangiaceae bacterium]
MSRPSIRIAGPADAAALLSLKRCLDRESEFMLFEPDERTSTAEELARHLEAVAHSDNSVVMVAGDGDGLDGYVELAGGKFRRNRTTTHLVIGVRAAAGGQGLGRALVERAQRWATEHGLRRLELTVMAHNHRAIGLYERMGFQRDGRRAEALLIGGQFLDELTMAILLPAEQPPTPPSGSESQPGPPLRSAPQPSPPDGEPG